MPISVADARVAVTGAASGIGRGIAEHLVAEGARVALLDRDATGLDAVAEKLGDAVLPVEVDLTDESAVAAAFERAVAWAGGLDGAVASAGVQLFGQDGAIQDLDLDAFDRTMAINTRGAVLTGKYAARAILANDREPAAGDATKGSIVMIGSPTGLIGQAAGFTAYSTSKAAVHGLARVMAHDLAPHGVRVNIVVPGFTRTPLVDSIFDDHGALDGLVAKIPLGRPGTPADVAPMVAYLLSDDARYSTGGFFLVEGGMLAV